MDLDEILSNSPPPEAPAPATPEPAAPETTPGTPESAERVGNKRKEWQAHEADLVAAGEGKFRDPETGQFVAKPEEPAAPATPAAPAVPTLTDKERALLRAAEDERRKRQALEQRLADLQAGSAQAVQTPQQTPQAEAKTFWDDPEGALDKFQGEMRGIVVKQKLDTSEAAARARYPDFDDKIAIFSEVVKRTPGMQHQWLAAPDPAEFAFRIGKNYQDLQAVGNIDVYKTNVEKEIRIKVEAEYKAKEAARAAAVSRLPGSISDAPGANPTRPVWSGPQSLDEILGGS